MLYATGERLGSIVGTRGNRPFVHLIRFPRPPFARPMLAREPLASPARTAQIHAIGTNQRENATPCALTAILQRYLSVSSTIRKSPQPQAVNSSRGRVSTSQPRGFEACSAPQVGRILHLGEEGVGIWAAVPERETSRVARMP
jgi:hypothetical protein